MNKKKQMYILGGLVLLIVVIGYMAGRGEDKTIYSLEHTSPSSFGELNDQTIEEVRVMLEDGKYVRVNGDAVEDGVVRARMIVLADTLEAVQAAGGFGQPIEESAAEPAEQVEPLKEISEEEREAMRAEFADLTQEERQARMAEMGIAPSLGGGSRAAERTLSAADVSHIGTIIDMDDISITVAEEGTGSIVVLYAADTRVLSR